MADGGWRMGGWRLAGRGWEPFTASRRIGCQVQQAALEGIAQLFDPVQPVAGFGGAAGHAAIDDPQRPSGTTLHARRRSGSPVVSVLRIC
jgi:hypothetical protein